MWATFNDNMVADFLLGKGQSREALGKRLTNKAMPWKRRRRTLQVITSTFSNGLERRFKTVIVIEKW